MKKINLKQFVKTNPQGSSSPKHISQSNNDSISYKLYLTCDKLPLEIFKDCLIDNDLTGLIIEGWAPPEKLEEVWKKIYVQYCELSQSPSFNEVFLLNKKIEDIRAKIHIANLSIKLLQLGYDKEIVEVLNSLALVCDLKPEDDKITTVKKLNSVVAQMKKWFPELKQKEKELAALRKDGAGKTDHEYFDSWLDIMSSERGYQVEASRITVSRFCRALIRITEKSMLENIKTKTHGRSTR